MTLIRPLLSAVLALAFLAAPAHAQGAEFPDSWFYYGGSDKPIMRRLRALEGKPAPALTLEGWVGTPRDLGELKGNVVVVEFWGMWCPPCRAAIPKNRKMVSDLVERDFVFIGVHSTRAANAWNKKTAVDMQINYSVGVDVENESAKAWQVGFWPTYAVIDEEGIVRAIGLQPNRVRSVVETLLGGAAVTKTPAATAPAAETPAPATAGSGIPRDWLEGPHGRRQQLGDLHGTDTPPALTSESWLNTEPLDLDALRGKVVVIDFWATWCGPCMRAVPHMNAMYEKHRDDGLVVIGVCAQRGIEKMEQVVRDRGMQYPICGDMTGALARRYKVNGFPDYYVIDRNGKLRIADCENSVVEKAVLKLLAEEAPSE
jgi:cytochrome c biogenesis protein CcmG/thiol:disulfide interchange protein DsbE